MPVLKNCKLFIYSFDVLVKRVFIGNFDIFYLTMKTQFDNLKLVFFFILMIPFGVSACDDYKPIVIKPQILLQEVAMQKEEVVFQIANASRLDKNTDLTIDFGDGQQYCGKVRESVKHAYTNTTTEGDGQEYTVTITVGDIQEKRQLKVYHLLAISELLKMWDDPSCKKILVMTHRAHTADPHTTENSISAVERSIAAGADIIETDTQLTNDGVVVISHDDDLYYGTDAADYVGQKYITTSSYEELMQYNLKYRDGDISNEKIPTLKEFLLAGRGKIYFNLDYSPRSASTSQVMEVVEELGMTQQVFYYCNTEDKVKEVFNYNADANAYCWSSSSTMLSKMREDSDKRYMIQLDGYPSSNQSQWENSYNMGFIVSANLLWVNHNELDEYGINQEYVDPMLDSGCVQVIHTDAPAELIQYLEQKGRR